MIKALVKPNKSKTEIVSIEDGVYTVNVAAPAEKNKANIEIVKFFSKKFGKKVRIKKGLKSRDKILEFIE